MAPVLAALQQDPRIQPLVVATTQHREMLQQALGIFGITPDIDLDLLQAGQDLGTFTGRAIEALTDCFRTHRPEYVLVQGDTSTVCAAALAAFYLDIPVGHVEAGLRSFDLAHPFPEEANRRIATAVATQHFAPTAEARDNLLAEGIPPEDVLVTGNTVVDALQMIPPAAHFTTDALQAVAWQERPTLLVTVHRRESLGQGLLEVCSALRTLHDRLDVNIVFPVHLNPRVRTPVRRHLDGLERVHLVDPLPYPDLLEVMRRSQLILSDSGGIQEEAPSLRKPILILRDTTERPECVTAGFGELVGTDHDTIVAQATILLTDPAAYARRTSGTNPFGDGQAGVRIARAVYERLQGIGSGAPRRRAPVATEATSWTPLDNPVIE